MSDTLVPAADGLPAYTLRVSDRAKHVRLTMTARDGLVVVVPRRMRRFDPAPVLRERRDWIAGAEAHVAVKRATFLGGSAALLPDAIDFRATGEHWRVEYRPSDSERVRARSADGRIIVSGAVADATACVAALQRWLQGAAVERLLPMLAEESERHGVAYWRAGVRGQRHRWGSCSSGGSISLNRCLLFLHPELVRAIVLHELAHIRHPNHSAAFWAELQGFDPLVNEHRTAIASAWDVVPPWAEP